ncbi:MAG TPA: hypothetical protein VFU06_05440 [Longimicrobiales bacterium]|nr:hypothetical protein [Longimicrobiales bacterium]
MSGSFHYSVYGERLHSTMPFPELHPAEPGPVRWSIQLADTLPDRDGMELLGEEAIYGSVSARLYRHVLGYRITVDDTGIFDLVNGCRTILWQPNAEPWWDFGRSHLLGRVIPMAMQVAGIMTLHGSGVQVADGVIGFVAPKHTGKSTLARLLLEAGARFVTDDALPLTTHAPILALPGIPSIRLRPGVDGTSGQGEDVRAGRDGKIALPPLDAGRVLSGRAPVAAIYLVTPARAQADVAPVRRRRLAGSPAVMGLVSQAKIGAMLGGRFAGALLRGAASIAAAVPVYELAVARDIDRLDEVVDQILTWHGGSIPLRVPAG